MNRFALTLLCLMPLPALADPPAALPGFDPGLAASADLGPPLTAAEFEAYAVGKTLTYGGAGAVWGQEEYLPGHQVIWAFTDQPCQYGTWTEALSADNAPMICFIYDDSEDQNCWQFYHVKTGLVALFVGEGNTALTEVDQTSAPMQCPGPKVGV